MTKFLIDKNESASIKLFLLFATKDLHFYIRFNKMELFYASYYKQIFH